MVANLPHPRAVPLVPTPATTMTVVIIAAMIVTATVVTIIDGTMLGQMCEALLQASLAKGGESSIAVEDGDRLGL